MYRKIKRNKLSCYKIKSFQFRHLYPIPFSIISFIYNADNLTYAPWFKSHIYFLLKTKKNYRLLNSSHVMLRTECLTKFSTAVPGARVGAVITYPEALFEKVVLSKTLSSNIISFRQGETIDVDGILKRFVEYGFERT